MSHNFTRSITLPLLFLVISSALLMLWLSGPYSTFVIAYAVLCMSFLITIWVIAVARWLYKKHRWTNMAYFIANLSWALMYVGIGVSLTIAVMPVVQEIAVIIFIFSILLGVGHFSTSIWRRLREGQHASYNNRFWYLVTSSSWFWRIWARWTTNTESGFTNIEKTAATIPPRPRSQSTENSPWRRISKPPAPETTKSTSNLPHQQVLPEQNLASATPILQKAVAPEQSRVSSGHITRKAEQPLSFAEQAKRLVTRRETKAVPVSFSQSWPTYEHMSAEQQQWYFFWRAELRSGNFLPADLSYLFVYVYECINLVGFEDPNIAFDRLVSFWQYYRVLQPKLDNYLIDWVADFTVIHQVAIQPLDWYARVTKLQVGSFDPELYVTAWLQTGSNWEEFSSEVLYRLAEFSPKRSKFRKAYQKHDLEIAYKQGIRAVDEFLQRSQGTSLLGLYRPPTMRTIQRIPFAGAHHDYDATSITIAKVHPWLGQTQLRKRLKSIIKQTENVLREQQQFETKLLGIDLPPAWITAIEQAFVVVPEKRAVTIDFFEVAELQRTSEKIRQRLAIAENEDAFPLETLLDQKLALPTIDIFIEEKTSISANPRQPLEQSPDVSVAYLQRPVNAPPDLLTDLVEIAAIMGAATSQEARLLALLQKLNWQASLNILTENYADRFVNVVLDRINERSIAQLGDALIFEEAGLWLVAEDYRDEIDYILAHPAYQSKLEQQNQDLLANVITPLVRVAPPTVSFVSLSAERVTQLSAEWMALEKALQEEHKTALSILLGGNNVTVQLDALARTKHITANQLIDQLNEIALETIRDIIIITNGTASAIEEEYEDHLVQLFGNP